MSSHGTFCTVFDCMDGRTKDVVYDWVREEFGVDHPDTITIAGCNGIIVSNESERERAFTMARISAEKHGATKAIIAGHTECAGFPVSNEEHHEALARAVQIIKDEGIFDTVVGLFVDVKTGEVLEICRA